jgi:hypothetical protein
MAFPVECILTVATNLGSNPHGAVSASRGWAAHTTPNMRPFFRCLAQDLQPYNPHGKLLPGLSPFLVSRLMESQS